MFAEYCNICQEHGELVPATIEFCVQRAGAEDAQYVRCCERHKVQGEVVAEIMQRNMAPAVLSSKALPAGAA
jgi:hypothetical protein